MMPEVNLKKIQRKVYMTYFEDGVWDIFLGLFLLGWGLSLLTKAVYLSGALFIGLYFTIWGVKKWITYPRTGYVKFRVTGRQRARTRFIILITAVLLLGVVMLLLMMMDVKPRWLSDYFPLLFNGILSVIVCFVAYWARVYRFYLYAILIFLAGVVHQWLGVEWEYGLIGAGAVIALIGLGLLISFLRKYPRTVEGVPNEDR